MEHGERLGLGIATGGHILLFGALSLGLMRAAPMPDFNVPTIEVAIADDIGLESRVTTRSTDAPRVAQAPELGTPEPDAALLPPPPADAAPTPSPEAPKPTPAPSARREPAPTPSARTTRPTPPQRSQPAQRPAPARRASRLGDNFLEGIDSPSASRGSARNAPGPMGRTAVRALNSEINRQLSPYWRPPSGADADRLVTLLSVHLDRNGAVIGRPELVGQNGVTASNRAQADLHSERAIQAVLRASPFINLPPEYYDQWKWLKPLRFDARLTR